MPLCQFPSALVAACCLISSATAQAPKRLLLLGQSPDGHPKTTHEYMAGVRVLATCLKSVPGIEIKIIKADDPWKEGPNLLEHADGVFLYLSEGARWIDRDPERRAAFAKLAARGGGIVALHWAVGTREARPIGNFVSLVGACHGGPDRKYKEFETDVAIAAASHPICRGLRPLHVRDEFYYALKRVNSSDKLESLLEVPIDGKSEMVAWAWQRPDGGRSAGFTGLHFHENWRLEMYRRLVVQSVLWSLKLPIAEKGLPVPISEDDLKLGAR
jgi:hypothetical protein